MERHPPLTEMERIHKTIKINLKKISVSCARVESTIVTGESHDLRVGKRGVVEEGQGTLPN